MINKFSSFSLQSKHIQTSLKTLFLFKKFKKIQAPLLTLYEIFLENQDSFSRFYKDAFHIHQALNFYHIPSNKGLKESNWIIYAFHVSFNDNSARNFKVYCLKAALKNSIDGTFWFGFDLSSYYFGSLGYWVNNFQHEKNHPQAFFHLLLCYFHLNKFEEIKNDIYQLWVESAHYGMPKLSALINSLNTKKLYGIPMNFFQRPHTNSPYIDSLEIFSRIQQLFSSSDKINCFFSRYQQLSSLSIDLEGPFSGDQQIFYLSDDSDEIFTDLFLGFYRRII